MTTHRTELTGLRKLVAILTIVSMPVVLSACEDEDGDGAVTDEEIEQLDEGLEDAVDQLEEEASEAQEAVDD